MGPHLKYNYNTDMKFRKALELIRQGGTYTQANLICGINVCTIRKYYEIYIAEYGTSAPMEPPAVNKIKSISFCDPHKVFTQDQENIFKKYLQYLSTLFYGLSENECRILGYQMAAINDSKMPNDWQYGMAASAWITQFKNRHPDLNIDKPERCAYRDNKSIMHEKNKISKFYDVLEKLFQTYPSLTDGARIFSLDETYTSSNVTKKKSKEHKVPAVTVCCMICGKGAYLPPVIVQPHKSMPINSAMPDTKYLYTSQGQLTADLFTEVIQHFIQHSNSTPDNPSILVMDIDLCHLSISAVTLAKSNGVNLVTYHPHSSNKLQPLQGGLFDLFQTQYNESLSNALDESKDSVDIGKVVDEALQKAMTPENIKDSFKKCGIIPFDRDLFTDSDYASCIIPKLSCPDCKERSKSSYVRPCYNPDTANDVSEEIACAPNDGKAETSDTSAGRETSSCENKNNGTEMSKEKRGAELDKLKRRMIRTVARLIKEKKTEEEVWNELKKQSGANCRKLWERMRSLTMKKLKRLFDADDRVDMVPAVAQMTLTDWLLYDLVIVHEKIDVIDRNQSLNSKVLSNLFALVQMFSIEGRTGNDLAEAWTAATVHYNAKGHQCSPMLMQRRWYQIKELTRHKMYKFWFNYRGNQRLLANANQDPPTELQKAIALRYPQIITRPFPEWQERIERRLVILPEEFEVKMRKKELMKPSDESIPDVVIVEQKIDTITLADSDLEYSDEENSVESNFISHNSNVNTDSDDTSQTPIIVNIKTEPQDESDYVYRQEEPRDRFQEEIDRLEIMEEKILSDEDLSRDVEISSQVVDEPSKDPEISRQVVDEPSKDLETSSQVVTQDGDMTLTTNYAETGNMDKENTILQENTTATSTEEKTTKTRIHNAESQESIVIDDDEEDIIPLKVLSEAQSKSTQVKNQSDNLVLNITSPDAKQNTNDNIDRSDDAIIVESDPPEPSVDNINMHVPATYSECDEVMLPIITSIASGAQAAAKIEFDPEIPPENLEEDVEYNADLQPYEEAVMDIIDIHDSSDNPSEDNISDSRLVKNEQSLNVDLAEDVLSTMNFADDGIEFVDDGIELDENDEDKQNVLNEHTSLQESENTEEEKEVTQKFDLKLLMNPVVYTTKLDEMEVYKDKPIHDTIEGKEIVDKIILESKPISAKSVNLALPEPNTLILDEVKVAILDPNEHGSNENYKNKNEIDENRDAAENPDAYEADDDLFHNDSSEESDCDVIEESKKVKLSSNLLQKPRSRSYNPIQLCKNPDFNTRLKRLTVGFFTSPRNRVLLSACKPMTIDLSKTFESKLIDGTMYLKPSDRDIRQIENDENITESTVSVMPSANPVQSLMDTTDVDKVLEEDVRKRMLERNKTINLPNITIVRQINQHLLMAEVAPIMAQTNTSSSTSPLDKTINIQQNCTLPAEEEYKNLKMNSDVENTNAKCDNSLLIERDKCPENNVVTYINSNVSGKATNDNPTNVANASQLVTDKNTLKIERRKRIDMPNWITKKYYDIKNESDSLLTIDTLYKMLNALDPCQEYASKFNSYKYKKKRQIAVVNKPQTQETPKPTPKPKSINVSALSSDIPKSKKRKASQRACCWARVKIEKLNSPTPGLIRLNKHTCKNICTCCCKSELNQSESYLEYMQTSHAVDSLSVTIEEVVNRSQGLSNISQPAVHIVNVAPNAENTSSESHMTTDIGLQVDIPCQNENVSTINYATDGKVSETAVDPEIFVPDKSREEPITIDLVDEDECELSKIKSPTPKIRVFSSNNCRANPFRATSLSARNKSMVNDPDYLATNAITQSAYPNMPLASQITLGHESLIQAQDAFCKKPDDLPCSCRPNVAVDLASATLLVDGSNACLRHSNASVSKETRIYLNRKHMAATERPFYVGKNKILLTNVKQPKPQPLPPDPTPIKLPDGVQIVMLPDNTVSYLVDPNVELAAEIIDSMPFILQAIKSHINASGITLPEPNPSRKEKDIVTINLDDNNAIQKLNITPDMPNPEYNNVNNEIRTPISTSIPTVTEDNSTDNYYICESDLQNHVDKESTNDNQSATYAELLDSTQQNEDVRSTDTGMDESGSKIDHQKLSSNEVNVVSKIVNDIPDGVADQSDLQNKLINSNESNTVPAVITNATNDVLDQMLQNKINEECTSDEVNTVSKLVIDTTSDEMKNKANKESSTNEVTAVSKAVVSTNNTNSATTDEVNLKEPNAMDTSELGNPTCLKASIANVEEELASQDNNNAPESSQQNEANTEKPNVTISTRRDLFSDLMEMSGIGEEDIAPAPQEPALQEPVTLTIAPESVMQPFTFPIDPEISLPFPPILPDIPVPPLSPISQKKHSISAQIDEKIHELHTITSFAELKYACDHDGLFFKLDLSNGIIVPINVCIQKTAHSASKLREGSSEVIDLTDEQGVSLNEPAHTTIATKASNEIVTTTRCISKLTPRKTSTMMPVEASQKPVKLIPRTYTSSKLSKSLPVKMKRRTEKITRNSPRISTPTTQKTDNIQMLEINLQNDSASDVQNTNKPILSRLSNNLKPLKTLQARRSINILRKKSLTGGQVIIPKRPYYADKIETKIDLVDSDAPMEEEYLVDESSEDSDDEPLAKIAKKLRPSLNEHDQQLYNTPQTEEMSQDESEAQDEIIDFEEAIDAIGPPASLRPTAVQEPVPTQLVLTGNALNQPILLNDMYMGSQEDDDSQEDCILGV